MRGKWNHGQPERVQGQPADNTSAYVMAQVGVWQQCARYLVPEDVDHIHPESAMEIAAWYQAPGNGFAVFTGNGTLPFGFKEEIQREIEKVRGFQPGDTESAESLTALRALLAYVYACS